MQSAYYPRTETATTRERPSSTLATTPAQHGLEIKDAFEAGLQDGEQTSQDSMYPYVSGDKGKRREVLNVNNSDQDDGSLSSSESPLSPGERIRVYESNCVSNSELPFAVRRKDVTRMDRSLISNVPNGMSVSQRMLAVHS
jgi:hypothetical protein